MNINCDDWFSIGYFCYIVFDWWDLYEFDDEIIGVCYY